MLVGVLLLDPRCLFVQSLRDPVESSRSFMDSPVPVVAKRGHRLVLLGQGGLLRGQGTLNLG